MQQLVLLLLRWLIRVMTGASEYQSVRNKGQVHIVEIITSSYEAAEWEMNVFDDER
jgi:hypothetical protein